MLKSELLRQMFVRYGFRFGAFTLMMVGILYYQQKSDLADSFQWIKHTAIVLENLGNFESKLKYGVDKKELTKSLEIIKNLTSDNLEQQKKIFKALAMLNEDTDSTTRSADSTRENMFVIAEDMIQAENKLYSTRTDIMRRNTYLLDLPIYLGGILACLLVFLANKVSREDIERLEQKDRDLRQSSEELALKSKIFQLLVESIGDGVVHQDEKGQFQVFNRKAQELMGYSLNEIRESKDLYTMLGIRDPKTRMPLERKLTALNRAKTGELVDDLEILCDNERIKNKILSFTARPILDELGQQYGAIAVFRDVTEKKEVETQLRLAEKSAIEAALMKSQFLANMSHEVRTPINGIVGLTQILENTQLDEKQKSYLSIINESCQSLMTIVNDVLDFSKVEAGKVDLEKTEFDLAYSVDKTVQILSHKARQRNLPVLTYIDPKIPKRLIGDSGRIGQILLNLLANAIKFTENGKILVRVSLEKSSQLYSYIKFEVIDSGLGLSEEQIGKLFQPFIQADSSTTRKYGGTGLGLSISKQLVELMGGQIAAERNQDSGSNFWFMLPLENVSGQALPTIVSTFGKGLNALVLDQDYDSAQILNNYLESWQMQTTTVSDFAKLESIYSDNDKLQKIDVVLISAFLINESIWNAVETIQKMRKENPVKILVISIDERLETLEKLKQHKISDHLFQPIEPSLFFNTLSQMFTKTALPQKDEIKNNIKSNDSKNYRILLAEDNQINQLIARTFISDLGYSIQVVSNGQEALDVLKNSQFDLVLMDCQMPVLDGFETTRQLRALKNKIPIIALTANAMKGDQERCLAAGMNDYMTKPFKKEDLQKILGKWLVDSLKKIS